MAVAFQKITVLSAAVGIGFAGAAAAYNAGTGYTVGQKVTYSGKTWVCTTASTNQTPTAAQSIYWCQVDATTGIPVRAKYLCIACETQAIRWRDDGIAPTAALGQLLAPTTATVTNQLWYTMNELPKISMIEVTPSASVTITYYDE